MGTVRKDLRIKKSFLKQVNVSDVMEELKTDNYFDKVHREMIACIKDTLPYKQLQEVAVKHMFDALTNASQVPDAEGRKEKTKQIAQHFQLYALNDSTAFLQKVRQECEEKIGLFSMQINVQISKIISERLSQEAPIIAKRALKRLSQKIPECSNSLSNRGKKRKLNEDSSEISPKTNEQNKRFQEEDDESDVSLDDLSDKSVSSVHTSDLSSFDDEIVVSSEDEKGEKKEKRISFKTADKAYLDGEFSKIHKIIANKKNSTDEASKDSKIEEKTLTGTSKSMESKISTSRPKRERKPNSKYSAEDLYL